MKLVVINIDYNKEVAENEIDDIISITCPFKQYAVSVRRSDFDNFTIADIIEEKEFENFNRIGGLNYFGSPIKFTAKIEDGDYTILFRDFVDYTEERKNKDLSKMFVYLRLKMSEVYHDIELYSKFVEGADIDGSMTGCQFCEQRHANNYCIKFNIIDPQKACHYYRFKRKI